MRLKARPVIPAHWECRILIWQIFNQSSNTVCNPYTWLVALVITILESKMKKKTTEIIDGSFEVISSTASSVGSSINDAGRAVLETGKTM